MPGFYTSIVRLGDYWRWVVLFILVATAVWIFLTPPKQQVQIAPELVRIQYWEKWTGEEGRQMKIIVDDFNSTVGKEKGIFVEYISMSSIDQKTLVATAAGVPPDIAGVWDAQVLQFAAMDALDIDRAHVCGLAFAHRDDDVRHRRPRGEVLEVEL